MLEKITFLLLCISFNVEFYFNPKLLEPNFKEWKTKLSNAILGECNNIPKDRDAKIVRLDSSICSRVSSILANIEISDREKLYKRLKNNYLHESNFDKLIMIDLSISGETTINDVLFLFVKGRKCRSIMCCKDFKELVGNKYDKFKIYRNLKDKFKINWYDENSRSFTNYIIITEFYKNDIDVKVSLNFTDEQFYIIEKLFYN